MTTTDTDQQPALSATELIALSDSGLRIERVYYREQIARLTAIRQGLIDINGDAETLRRVTAARAKYEHGCYAIRSLLRSRVDDPMLVDLHMELMRAAIKLSRLSRRDDISDDQIEACYARLDAALQALNDHGVLAS